MDEQQARKILIIEDDSSLRLGLKHGFLAEGFGVETAADGRVGLEAALAGRPEMVILDLTLPKLDGMEVLAGIRRGCPGTAVIVLTARGGEADRIAGLEGGADDYVVKPFSFRELLLRVQAVLRRGGGEQVSAGCRRTIGEVVVDFDGFQVCRDGAWQALSRKEAEALRLLMDNPGRVISREEFLDRVWGMDRFPTTRTVDMHILKLRQKIEPHPKSPRYIVTVHGVGYKFVG